MPLYKVPVQVCVTRPAEYIVEADDVWDAVEKAETGDTISEDYTGLGEVTHREIDGDPELEEEDEPCLVLMSS